MVGNRIDSGFRLSRRNDKEERRTGNQIVSGSLENTLEDKNLGEPPEVRLSRRNDKEHY